MARPEKSYRRGRRLCTVDLLVLTSLDQLLKLKNIISLLYKTSYLNEEVNCTEPSPSVGVPRHGYHYALSNVTNEALAPTK
jgi:hypothetical protein